MDYNFGSFFKINWFKSCSAMSDVGQARSLAPVDSAVWMNTWLQTVVDICERIDNNCMAGLPGNKE